MTASQRAMRRIHAVAKDAGIGTTAKETHDYLHNWALTKDVASLKDLPDNQLDAMADWINDDPAGMAAWFDQYAPVEFERMAPEENAEPGESSTIRHLFTPEQEADLHAAADRIQRREQYTR